MTQQPTRTSAERTAGEESPVSASLEQIAEGTSMEELRQSQVQERDESRATFSYTSVQHLLPLPKFAGEGSSEESNVDESLNSVTKITRIDDTLDALAQTKYFTTLDLASGYWQVEMHPDSVEKTAFITHSGLYEFRVMPFGLCNAPATFQRLMETILAGLNRECCMAYLDDVLVIGKNFHEHLENFRRVYQRVYQRL